MNEIPIDKLGPFPILQFAVAVVVLSIAAFSFYRGSRDRNKTDTTAGPQPEQRYYFDGPIGEALKLLRDQRNILHEVKGHVEPLGELGRNANKELGEIKDHINDIKGKPRRR